jgi:hypothetical protein
MPAHPQCLCFATIETVEDVDQVVRSLKTEYGL